MLRDIILNGESVRARSTAITKGFSFIGNGHITKHGKTKPVKVYHSNGEYYYTYKA